MSTITYGLDSFYRETGITDNHLNLWKELFLSNQSTDEKVKIPIQYHKRPDLMSFAYYNNVNYWWVFSLRNINVLIDPINDFVAGLEIYIPTINNISSKNIT